MKCFFIFITLSLFLYTVMIAAENEPENNEYMETFINLQYHYSWMDSEIYKTYREYALLNNVDIYFICATAQVESKGKNVIGKPNWNNTVDIGRLQVNSLNGDPKKLMELDYNTKIGTEKMAEALKISGGDILQAARLYNQGPRGKAKNYKNWNHARKILHYYNLTKGVNFYDNSI